MSEAVDARVARPAGISYLQIPTVDPQRSCAFYAAVFGWAAERDRFQDGTGHVIGHFVRDRSSSQEDGIRPYVYVSNVDETLARATGNGGAITEQPYAEGDLRVATFRDPFGNVIGVWQAAKES